MLKNSEPSYYEARTMVLKFKPLCRALLACRWEALLYHKAAGQGLRSGLRRAEDTMFSRHHSRCKLNVPGKTQRSPKRRRNNFSSSLPESGAGEQPFGGQEAYARAFSQRRHPRRERRSTSAAGRRSSEGTAAAGGAPPSLPSPKSRAERTPLGSEQAEGRAALLASPRHFNTEHPELRHCDRGAAAPAQRIPKPAVSHRVITGGADAPLLPFAISY